MSLSPTQRGRPAPGTRRAGSVTGTSSSSARKPRAVLVVVACRASQSCAVWSRASSIRSADERGALSRRIWWSRSVPSLGELADRRRRSRATNASGDLAALRASVAALLRRASRKPDRAAFEIPGERRVGGLVEVVDPEDRHVVRAGHHAEVLRVHVAERQHGRHPRVLARHVAVEQQAGAAEERVERPGELVELRRGVLVRRLRCGCRWSSRIVCRTCRRRSLPVSIRGSSTTSPRARRRASCRNVSNRDSGSSSTASEGRARRSGSARAASSSSRFIEERPGTFRRRASS